MAKKKKKSKGAQVLHPLTPTNMTEFGVLTAPPPGEDGFTPDGSWSRFYRIWTCYGYRSGSNRDSGYLFLSRKVADNAARLKAHQVLLNAEGTKHSIEARIRCRTDATAAPVEWTVTSSFSGGPDRNLPDVTTKESARIDGQTLAVTVGGRTRKRKLPGPVAADWCLFDAVQRLPFRKGEPLGFALLEGMSLAKEDHRLSYRGRIPVTWGPKKVPLHCFQQTGRGVYPYEYWLGDDHRLLMVVTGPRTYIADPNAKDILKTTGSKKKGGGK